MAEKSNVPYDTISRLSIATQSLFSKCCFCVPLRLGCFILGYMNLVTNILQNLGLFAAITFIGLTTHGFDHFDKRPSDDGTDSPDVQGLDKPVLTQVGLLLVVILVVNTLWLIINIACLVGLHKKRPGPIRVYVGLASARLILSLASFIFLMMKNNPKPRTIIVQSFDLGLTAYFILVYYIYAIQMERERKAEIAQPAPVNDVYIYPIKPDKSQQVA